MTAFATRKSHWAVKNAEVRAALSAKHGLATAHRLVNEKWESEYLDIKTELFERIQSYPRGGRFRDELNVRYQNTLERLADGHLLSQQPDYPQAVDFYKASAAKLEGLKIKHVPKKIDRLYSKLIIAAVLSQDEPSVRNAISERDEILQ